MLDLTELTLLLLAHWAGDFLFQTDAMAKGKSSSNLTLFRHVLAYTIPFALIGFIIPVSLLFLLAVLVVHFATDYITSRVNKKLMSENKIHEFYVVLGLDQMIHVLTAVWAYAYLIY